MLFEDPISDSFTVSYFLAPDMIVDMNSDDISVQILPIQCFGSSMFP